MLRLPCSKTAVLLISLGMLLPSGRAAAARFSAQNAQAACAHANLNRSSVVDGFAFNAYHDEKTGTACFEVLSRGKVIFRRTDQNDGDYFIGQHPNPERQWDVPDIPDGRDITGNGDPDMIVFHYSGGAHCCLSTSVFGLQPSFRLLATLDAEDSWPAYFSDLDNNGRYYYLSYDWTFAYWPQSFAASPVAPIILRFVPDGNGGGSYHLALDKMRKPAPSAAAWTKSLQEAHATFAEDTWELDIGAPLWGTVMNLIYDGHSELAWKFLDEAWPSTVAGKGKWLTDFCSRLKTSPYWGDLKLSLEDAPSVCAQTIPAPKKRE